MTDAEIAGYMGWRGPGAYTATAMRRIRMVINKATNREREACEKACDAFPQAHRLALELECLLLDTKDMATVSKWWDSANEALEQWRAFCRTEAETLNVCFSTGGADPIQFEPGARRHIVKP